MKNFKDWGIKIRRDPAKGYYAIWNDLETVRLDLGDPVKLDPDRPEFVDVGVNTRCNASCPFCYVSAGSGGTDWKGICETWKAWMDTFPPDIRVTPENADPILRDIITPDPSERDPDAVMFQLETMYSLVRHGAVYTEKPTQIACGSTGEPTIHPEFPEFLETVFSTGVVPNYTTNGVLLASDSTGASRVLEATAAFCGGVAVSFGNKSLRGMARKAIERLAKEGDCKVMIHHIIGSSSDVDELLTLDKEFKDTIHYHVLLPLMAHGRSREAMGIDTYDYLTDMISKTGMTNLAFGANFSPFMKARPGSLNVWAYPEEHYSENILLQDGKVVITPSSFDLDPIKTIDLREHP